MTIRTAPLLLLLAAGCIPSSRSSFDAKGEWISAPADLRKVTAVVRATPPPRLKATFEAAAARTDDADYAAFLRGQASGGFGSGFVMVHRNDAGPTAFIVTNRHVVAEAERVEVSFADGATYKDCEVVYVNPKADLAVVALPDSALRAVGARTLYAT